MTLKSVKVITFDLDDTLWSVRPVLIHAEQQLYQWLHTHAPKVTDQFSLEALLDFRQHYSNQRPDLTHQISQLRISALEKILCDVGYTPIAAKDLADQAFTVFIDARHQITLFDTVTPMLESLKTRYKLGVLTNGNANINRLDIGRFFDFSFSAEQLNASKPSPDHFIAAQKVCHCKAENIIHVGDHIEHDIDAAQQAGCLSIWFNPEKKTNNSTIKPDHQVQCLSEIVAAINTLEAQRINPS